MPKISSSIGQAHSAGNTRTWSVPDADFPDEDQVFIPEPSMGQRISPEEVKALRARAQQNQQNQVNQANQSLRTRVAMITGIGRRTKMVTIDFDENTKTIFGLRTLKSREQNAVTEVIESAEFAPDGRTILPTSIHRIKIEALKHSLFQIDGVDVDVVLSCSEKPEQERLQAKEWLLNEMDNMFVNHLFEEYEKLLAETADGYGPPTTEAEAKEAAEAIHKSGA